MLGSLASLAASSSTTSSGGSSIQLVVFLALIIGAFYFLLIRPQQRRQRQQRSMIQSIGVGDEIMTIGGIYGTVVREDDDSFTIEVAPGIDIRITRSAVARKLNPDEPDDLDDEDDDDQQDEPHEQEAGDQA